LTESNYLSNAEHLREGEAIRFVFSRKGHARCYVHN